MTTLDEQRRAPGPAAPRRGRRGAPAPADSPRSRRRRFRRPHVPYAWPLWALLVLYPVWWLLGLGTFIYPILAVPMTLYLLLHRPIKVPPGFGIWLIFLAWFLASTLMLKVNPPETYGDSGGMRYLGVVMWFGLYLSATVLLLYVGNLTEQQLPRTRLIRWLSVMFLTTVAGGLLGMLWPGFGFTSPVEMVLPQRIASNNFVQSLVHPNSAQVMNVLGYESPRPAAPFGYTNLWGYNFSMLLIWFVVGWWIYGGPRRRLVTTGLLTLALVPAVYSLNRGMWLAVGFAIVYVAVRLALRGRLWVVAGLSVVLIIGALIFAVTPLHRVAEARLTAGHSDSIRVFLTVKTLEVTRHSPVIGFGNTRNTIGSAKSRAAGRTQDCQGCGNHALGSNGQLWMVMISQGYVGAALFTLFFLFGVLRYWTDTTPIGQAGVLILLMTLIFNLFYSSLVTPLGFTMLTYALLWRNDIERARLARRVNTRRRLREHLRGRRFAARTS